jgi:2,3-diaminopropionate biosynthesis protein SbnB
MATPLPNLRVLTGADVAGVLEGNREECLDVVRRAYLAHDAGETVNPQSAFLRFPHLPRSRIISLPAYLGGEFGVAGIKWIASFPDNRDNGLPRASAVLLLNDAATGFPFACLESSIISAARTAGSAVLAAQTIVGERRAKRIGVVGTGLIARQVWKFLNELSWDIGGWRLFDLDRAAADRFAARLTEGGATDVVVVDGAHDAFADCDLVVLTTVAGEPHLHEEKLLDHAPVVLHLSLRDLAPELILAATNITDDIDHAVRERTSLHLTEQRVGHRDFVHGTLADLLVGRVSRPAGEPVVFSPFGLGVLDLAVGAWVHDRVTESGGGRDVPDFYDEVAS